MREREAPHFQIGDLVSKQGGDYRFDGTVVAVFWKLSGVVRYVVEDDRGVLHTYSTKNLRRRSVEVPQLSRDSGAADGSGGLGVDPRRDSGSPHADACATQIASTETA